MVGKHKSEDYKITAVEYYLNNGDLRETCEIFSCPKSSLQRWVKRYNQTGRIVRKSSDRLSYKVTEEMVDLILKAVKMKVDLTLAQLAKMVRKRLGIEVDTKTIYNILDDNNITRKRLRKKYYPEKKAQTEGTDLATYYSNVNRYSIDKVVSIDETAVYLNMRSSYGRSKKGRRVIVKTHQYPFVKFNLISAITSRGVIGMTLYEDLKGGIKSDELLTFLNTTIRRNKLRNYLILLDNAPAHKANKVKEFIRDRGNELLYTVPYHPETNPIEEFYSQLKHYIRRESPQDFRELKRVIEKTVKKRIKPIHLHNYFIHAFLRY